MKKKLLILLLVLIIAATFLTAFKRAPVVWHLLGYPGDNGFALCANGYWDVIDNGIPQPGNEYSENIQIFCVEN